MAFLENWPRSFNPHTVTLGVGIFGIADFVLQPLHVFLAYLVAEGFIRALAVLTTDEMIGTLPLYLVSGIHGLLEAAYRKYELGPPILDEIQDGDGETHDILVLSCRPKRGWNPYITVRFRDEFYVLAGEETGPKPRPFRYRLRKNPVGRSVVVIREYDLDEPVSRPPYCGL